MNPHFILQANPKASYLQHASEIQAAIQRTLDSGQFILACENSAFEQEFAGFLGSGVEAITVANGTEALTIALLACGVPKGTGVITPAHTAAGTIAAIELAGAIPIFADIDPDSFTLCPDSVEAVIMAYHQSKASEIAPLRAIIAVHLYGHPANLRLLSEVARKYSLLLVEDCAQSHGALFENRSTGTWGHAAAFSFYPTKNLGTLGDGGAVVTTDPSIASRCRLLRQYGWRERYISEVPGINSRLDEIQASILRVKLCYLSEDNARRREIASRYDALLEPLEGLLLKRPRLTGPVQHAFHQYVIRVKHRAAVRKACEATGVGTLVHYPVPIHLQPAYSGRIACPIGGLPRTEVAADEVLSLPMYPALTDFEIDRVGATITQILKDLYAELD